MAAYRCSNCNLNYPVRKPCQVCGEPTDYLANAQETEDLEEQISVRKRVAAPLVPENEKIFTWRRDELVDAGYPWDYAVKIAKDREFDLHHTRKVLVEASRLYGDQRGLELALEIIL